MCMRASDMKSLDRLSEKDLRELLALDIELESAKQDDILQELLETTITITGKKGRGKTLTGGVAIPWQLRERFGRGVVVVGSKMGLKPEFGPYQQMSEEKFRDELERVDLAASEEDNAEQVAQAFEKYGVSILYKTIVFDEAGKLFERRRGMDKLVQLMGYFIDQSRHYHVTTLLLAPSERRIDQRIVDQAEWHGKVFHNKFTDVATLKLTQGLEVRVLEIDGSDGTLHTPYYEMYNSWAMLGYRRTSLEITKF